MRIRLIDPQGILNRDQRDHAKNRVRFSLARFDHRVNEAIITLALFGDCDSVSCSIDVSVEDAGTTSVIKRGVSYRDVLNRAADAIEPKVAYHVDWRMWFNADTLATCVHSLTESIKDTYAPNSAKPQPRPRFKKERRAFSLT